MANFNFPSADHEASIGFCPDHFAEVCARKSELKTLPEMRFEARNGAVAVQGYCLLADDTIAIVRVGVRGGKRVLWKFDA